VAAVGYWRRELGLTSHGVSADAADPAPSPVASPPDARRNAARRAG
jgi:hypothetical protein